MAGLEATLRITAKDDAGAAFAQIKRQIEALDKQVGAFDKLMAAAGRVAKANDPMIAAINAGSAALKEQKTAVVSLGESLTGMSAGTGAATRGQETLAGATAETTRVMVAQGAEAEKIGGQIVAAQKRATAAANRRKEEGGGALSTAGTGIIGMVAGLGLVRSVEDAAKDAASLEEMRTRVKGVSGGNAGETAFAEQLAREIAAKYPAITEAKALDTYLELRANAMTQTGQLDEARARRNLFAASQAQVAGAALGFEVTPRDTQNLMKAVEGTGQANDPAAVEKVLDLFIKGKQIFGSALTSDMMRDFVQTAKAANFSLGDDAFVQNMVRMTEGNASRLGNEVAQTMQTLVGGHMTKQTGLWLEHLHLVKGLVKQGGGKVTATGLTRSDLLQTEPVEWANQFLLPAIEKTGALSEKNVRARMNLLRADALKAGQTPDDRVLRERAEQGLISAELSKSGMRTTVTDQLAHAIANELLINRDVAAVKAASSSKDAAALIGQNPFAALKELTESISNFMAVVVDPAMPAAAHALDVLAHALSGITDWYHDFAKANPKAAEVVRSWVVRPCCSAPEAPHWNGQAAFRLRRAWRWSGCGRDRRGRWRPRGPSGLRSDWRSDCGCGSIAGGIEKNGWLGPFPGLSGAVGKGQQRRIAPTPPGVLIPEQWPQALPIGNGSIKR